MRAGVYGLLTFGRIKTGFRGDYGIFYVQTPLRIDNWLMGSEAIRNAYIEAVQESEIPMPQESAQEDAEVFR